MTSRCTIDIILPNIFSGSFFAVESAAKPPVKPAARPALNQASLVRGSRASPEVRSLTNAAKVLQYGYGVFSSGAEEKTAEAVLGVQLRNCRCPLQQSHRIRCSGAEICKLCDVLGQAFNIFVDL